MDPITLDIRTLSFITTSIGILFSIGLFIFGRIQNRFRGFSLLALACASFGIGILSLGLRDYLPTIITIVFANILINAGLVFFYEGTCQFLGVANNKKRSIGIIAILTQFGLFYYYTYQAPSINNRIIVISVIAAVLSALSALELLRNRQDSWKVAGSMTAFIFLGYSLYSAFRAVYTIKQSSIDSFMLAGNIHGMAFLALILLITGSTFGYIWMVSKSLEFELRELANHDQLTKILNRRGIEVFAQQEFSKMNRFDTDLALIMVDIDHFKSVNDRFGHQIGDEVLANFASLINLNLRPFDIFGRLGGEEFVLILPNTTSEQALILAERLRKEVEEFSFDVENREIRITASFGIASQIPETDILEKLIPFADKALYQSKQQGRNKVTLFTSSS